MPRSDARRLLAGTVVSLVAGFSALVTPAAADTATGAVNDTVTVTGAGWGHGYGMSQYGAYGAASQGKTWQQIVGFYYPKTTLATLPSGNQIRVWIGADTDSNLVVLPATGLRLHDLSGGTTWTFPSGTDYTQWRITRSSAGSVLSYRTPAGTWAVQKTSLPATALWQVENPGTGVVKVLLPGSRLRELRGQVSLSAYRTGARTVNRLSLEDYLKSVVPLEMPTSWGTQAVRAQAVAARSFAARTRAGVASSASYDICDTASCQVYQGMAETSGGRRTLVETSAGTAAITATAGQVVRYGDTIALTQFSSSNGGAIAQGGYPYLAAKVDPYDAVMHNEVWSVPLSRARIQVAYPTVGTLRSIQVTSRDGTGRWGGRVLSLTITGSNAGVRVTGDSFRSTFGLKSRLFEVTGGLAPGTANYTRWQTEGGVLGWIGEPTESEQLVAGGLAARFAGADLYWSSATGSHEVHGGIRAKYRSLGGPSFRLGYPTTDQTHFVVPGARENKFTGGGIVWSSSTGAHIVVGSIWTYYDAMGASVVRLGVPTTDEMYGKVAGSYMSRFTKGAIYMSSATRAHDLTGYVYPKYQTVGEEGSRLGLPITNVVTTSSGTKATFVHGTITCTTQGSCSIAYG